MKKWLLFVPALVSCNALICCTTTYPTPQPQFSFSADPKDMFGFTNGGFSEEDSVAYKVSVSGDIEEGDVVELKIQNQICQKRPVSYLYIPFEYLKMKLNPQTKEFTFKVNKFDSVLEQIFITNFDLVLSVMRNEDIVYSTTINNFEFYCATPTFDEMMSKEQWAEGYAIKGFDFSKPWVSYQLSLCNMFYLPDDSKQIVSNAFYKDDVSTLSNSIKVINLSTKNSYLQRKNTLVFLGENAFSNSSVEKIILPQSLAQIGTKAFANCQNLQALDLSDFEMLPINWSTNVFDNVTCSLDKNPCVYVANNYMAEEWQQYFDLNEENSNISQWSFLPIG